MSQYTDKSMELADRYSVSSQRDGVGGYEHPLTETRREALRQHIEAGAPDCRTCFYFNPAGINGYVHASAFCGHCDCKNFSNYARADYTPLCEVTHD